MWPSKHKHEISEFKFSFTKENQHLKLAASDDETNNLHCIRFFPHANVFVLISKFRNFSHVDYTTYYIYVYLDQ
jgi:hypothetical protein